MINNSFGYHIPIQRGKNYTKHLLTCSRLVSAPYVHPKLRMRNCSRVGGFLCVSGLFKCSRQRELLALVCGVNKWLSNGLVMGSSRLYIIYISPYDCKRHHCARQCYHYHKLCRKLCINKTTDRTRINNQGLILRQKHDYRTDRTQKAES